MGTAARRQKPSCSGKMVFLCINCDKVMVVVNMFFLNILVFIVPYCLHYCAAHDDQHEHVNHPQQPDMRPARYGGAEVHDPEEDEYQVCRIAYTPWSGDITYYKKMLISLDHFKATRNNVSNVHYTWGVTLFCPNDITSFLDSRCVNHGRGSHLPEDWTAYHEGNRLTCPKFREQISTMLFSKPTEEEPYCKSCTQQPTDLKVCCECDDQTSENCKLINSGPDSSTSAGNFQSAASSLSPFW